jgi:hypothetical protein
MVIEMPCLARRRARRRPAGPAPTTMICQSQSVENQRLDLEFKADLLEPSSSHVQCIEFVDVIVVEC